MSRTLFGMAFLSLGLTMACIARVWPPPPVTALVAKRGAAESGQREHPATPDHKAPGIDRSRRAQTRHVWRICFLGPPAVVRTIFARFANPRSLPDEG